MVRQLHIKTKANLHNKYELILTDARTGKIKQEAVAYNIICNGLFTGWHSWARHTGSRWTWSRSIWSNFKVGDGTGTLEASRSSLFNELGNKISSEYDKGGDMNALTSYQTRRAVWDETELQNQNITEVGCSGNHSSLSSHALIEDSEGNPITVEKGEYDILTVYCTFYMVLDEPSYGENVKWIASGSFNIPSGTAAANYPLAVLAYDMTQGTTTYDPRCRFGSNNDAPQASDDSVKEYIDLISLSYNWSTADKKFTFGPSRLGADGGNHVDGIWEIGVTQAFRTSGTSSTSFSLFRSVMPIPAVWDGYNLEGEELGMGDGTKTEFQTQWSPIVENSETIKVDNTEQTKDTDYTIDYTTGDVVFLSGSIPGDGEAVTSDYSIEQIPKDENHVLDVTVALEVGDANA